MVSALRIQVVYGTNHKDLYVMPTVLCQWQVLTSHPASTT